MLCTKDTIRQKCKTALDTLERPKWSKVPTVTLRADNTWDFGEHLRSIEKSLPGFPLAEHFNSNGHALQDAQVRGEQRPQTPGKAPNF